MRKHAGRNKKGKRKHEQQVTHQVVKSSSQSTFFHEQKTKSVLCAKGTHRIRGVCGIPSKQIPNARHVSTTKSSTCVSEHRLPNDDTNPEKEVEGKDNDKDTSEKKAVKDFKRERECHTIGELTFDILLMTKMPLGDE